MKMRFKVPAGAMPFKIGREIGLAGRDVISGKKNFYNSLNKRRFLFRKDVYCRLHLPVNALTQNMFSHDVKRLRFRCQTLKFSHPNVKFPRQSFAVITVRNVRQICENPFTDILRAEKASRTSSEK